MGGVRGVTCAHISSVNSPLVIKHSTAYEQYVDVIKETFSGAQFLEHVTFHSDSCMQQEEFFYLVELKEASFIRAADIARAVGCLLKKNIFEQIVITTTPGVCGICMHFEFKSFLTLGRVKIRGILTDKQTYTRCYVIDRGDRFSNQCHERSLEKMDNLCRGEGYFNTTITSLFTHDDLVKVVNPTITISKGSLFTINAADIEVVADADMAENQKTIVQKKIYRTFLKRLLKKSYNKKQLNQLAVEIKEYLAHKGFAAAAITLNEYIDKATESVRLQWHIDLHHKCLCMFWGNHFFSDNQLHQHMREFCRSTWLLPASLLAQEIERLYREKGFWHISIEVQEEKERYFFMIKEGLRASIDRVELVHMQSMDARAIIKSCFGGVLKAAHFDQKLLDTSFGAVRAFYEKKGFLDMRIVGHEYIGSDQLPGCAENAYKLRVMIDEGEVKKCVGIEVPLFPEICAQQLLKHSMKGQESVVLHPQLLSEQRLFLQNYMRNQGYRLIRIEPMLKGQRKNEVVVVWHVECDKVPVRFGKTIVQGNCTYPFDRLMRELQYERGQLWQQEALKKTFLQFKKRSVFDAIYLYSDHKSMVPGEKAVLLKLLPDDPFEVRVRAGLGFQNIQNYQTFGGLTYKLGSSFMVKNLTNRADILSAQVDFARSHRELVLKYSLPWVFQLPCDGLVQAYSTRYEQPGFIGSKKNIYTITQHGLLAGAYKKTAHFDGGINVGCEGMRTTVESGSCDTVFFVEQVARAIDFTPRLQNKMVPFFFVEPTLYFNYLDDTLNPTYGMYTLVSAKSMVPLSFRYEQSFFIKLLAEQAFFAPIARSVMALRMRCGHIFYQQFSAIMPAERFYLGGSHSLRGYNADAAPPLGVFVDAHGNKQTVPRGGKTMANVNAEIRVPLMAGVSGVLFQDVGLLCGSLREDLRIKNAVAATGFGVRIHTPVGPLRFDIGFNWHRHSALESRFAWFLTFGQAF